MPIALVPMQIERKLPCPWESTPHCLGAAQRLQMNWPPGAHVGYLVCCVMFCVAVFPTAHTAGSRHLTYHIVSQLA